MNRRLLGIALTILVLTAMGCAVADNAKKAPARTTGTAAKAQPKALPRLLDLGATTCIPCKMMAKVLDELKSEYKGKLQVDFIDVAKDPSAVGKYKVRVIPLQIFYDAKGKELYRHEGYYPKADVVKKFKELGIDLTK